jgi:hypothetical protein
MNSLPECDYCESTDSIKIVNGSNTCPAHRNEPFNKSTTQGPIAISEVLKVSREVDNRVQVRTDLFNAATVAIQDLKKAIEADESITNKPYALALELHNRYNKMKSVIFELQEQVVEKTNEQKAVQIYLNQLANTLRAEERDKLKIQDINYQPRAIKMPVTAKTIKLSKKRLDKKELRQYATLLGVPEFTLQMICIQKNIDAKTGYEMMKRSLDAAKAQSQPAVIVKPEVVTDEEIVDMTGQE